MVQLLLKCGAESRTSLLLCQGDEDVKTLKQQLSCARPDAGPPASMVLLFGGRVLADHMPLAAYGLSHGSTIHVSSRLRGGGGDGGSTGAESRSCYLEMYQGKKPDKVNPAEELLARWTRCHLTGAALEPPCVIDELGNLYNKDAVLQALLSKSMPAALSYITGLKALTELKLAVNSHYKGDQPKAAVRGLHQPSNESRFHCPITDLEFNGRFKFLVHRKTGTVVSEKAVKEVPAVVGELVGGAAAPDDWIPVNPSGEQLEKLKERQAAKMAAEREKKAKKAAAKLAASAAAGAGPAGVADGSGAGLSGGDAAGSRSNGNGSGPSSSPEQPAANGTAKPGAVGQKRSSPPPPAPPAAATAAAAAAAAAQGVQNGQGPPAKKAKALEVMPKHATGNVYASLFTSSLPKEAFKESYLCRNTSARGMHLS